MLLNMQIIRQLEPICKCLKDSRIIIFYISSRDEGPVRNLKMHTIAIEERTKRNENVAKYKENFREGASPETACLEGASPKSLGGGEAMCEIDPEPRSLSCELLQVGWGGGLRDVKIEDRCD